MYIITVSQLQEHPLTDRLKSFVMNKYADHKEV